VHVKKENTVENELVGGSGMLTGWAIDTFKRIQNTIGNTCRTVKGLVFGNICNSS
jgi:hypothetical protein